MLANKILTRVPKWCGQVIVRQAHDLGGHPGKVRLYPCKPRYNRKHQRLRNKILNFPLNISELALRYR